MEERLKRQRHVRLLERSERFCLMERLNTNRLTKRINVQMDSRASRKKTNDCLDGYCQEQFE